MSNYEKVIQWTKICLMLIAMSYAVWRVETIISLLKK